METTKNSYVLCDGVWYRQPPASRLNCPDPVLREFCTRTGTRVEGISVIDGTVVNAAFKEGECVVWQRINKINLKTTFSITGEVLVPQFSVNTNFIERSLVWNTPNDMSLYFAVHMMKSGHAWDSTQAIFFAVKNGTPGYYRLPLSNLYDDGRICLGRNWPDGIAHYAIDGYEAALRKFQVNSWNADIMPAMEHCHRLFRFNPSNNLQLPTPYNWQDYCRRVNHAQMAEVHP